MTETISIASFLRGEGFDTGESLERARALLEVQQFTRPGKQGMADTKLPAARRALADGLRRLCPSDAGLAATEHHGADGREVVMVAGPSCEVCGGSNNRRAALKLGERIRSAGLTRMLVVGGTPTQHAEMDQLLAKEGLHLRYIDGATGSYSKRDALPDLQWAQVMVVWGATPLPHKVSHLYTDDPPPLLRVVKFARRGIEALCEEILRSLG